MAEKTRPAGGGRDADKEAILEAVREARNFDFRRYKRSTLWRRIERRMSDRRCETARDYLALLGREPQELDALVSALLIKVTSFFRDPETWEAIAREVLPELLARKPAGQELRVWSAGCATGQEVYSLAILVAEALGPRLGHREIKIFGTDLDEQAVAAARRGIYTEAQLEGLSRERVKRWLRRVPEGYAVAPELRRLVVFGTNNLVSDAPISRIDLLLCRNVFIYLDAELQRRVLRRFHYALRSEGVLVLGRSELIGFAGKIFEPVNLTRRIYRKGSATMAEQADERLAGMLEQANVTRAAGEARAQLNGIAQVHVDVVSSLPLPLVGTTADGSVVLWNDAAARLWRRAAEEVLGRKLAALGLPGLPGSLIIDQAAAVRAGRVTAAQADGTLAADGDGEAVTITTEIAPLRETGGNVIGLLYLARDVTAARRLETELRGLSASHQRANEELQTANEELQSANEELETTNEELQSANEELQTTNEELQSTNEELETTNEELQATNAELDATNRELAHRTDELDVLSFYQKTIIRSLSAAVVVIDTQGRISMWNLAAERLFGITEREALGQLLWTLRLPLLPRSLLARMRRTLERKLAFKLDRLTFAVPGGRQGRASLRAVPLTPEGRTLGAVVIVEELMQTAARARPGRGGRQ